MLMSFFFGNFVTMVDLVTAVPMDIIYCCPNVSFLTMFNWSIGLLLLD